MTAGMTNLQKAVFFGSLTAVGVGAVAAGTAMIIAARSNAKTARAVGNAVDTATKTLLSQFGDTQAPTSNPQA